MNRVRIAVQNTGRLADASLQFLASFGVRFEEKSRSYLSVCTNAPLDVVFLRDDDIPEYVTKGVADFGIVGENVLLEKQANLKVVKKLEFALCSLVLAIPQNSQIVTLKDLEGERIATSYPRLLKTFLAERQIEAAVIELQGSVEIAPALNLADAICDLTQTGKTLRENSLKVIETVLQSQAVLVSSPTLNSAAKKIFNSLFFDKSLLCRS